jgi:hypothetical protein
VVSAETCLTDYLDTYTSYENGTGLTPWRSGKRRERSGFEQRVLIQHRRLLRCMRNGVDAGQGTRGHYEWVLLCAHRCCRPAGSEDLISLTDVAYNASRADRVFSIFSVLPSPGWQPPNHLDVYQRHWERGGAKIPRLVVTSPCHAKTPHGALTV